MEIFGFDTESWSAEVRFFVQSKNFMLFDGKVYLQSVFRKIVPLIAVRQLAIDSRRRLYTGESYFLSNNSAKMGKKRNCF